MRRLAKTLISAAAMAAALAAPAAAKTYALVIGIDDYAHITDLDGAVNDARDIAGALSDLAETEVTLLLNEAASRDAILTHWRRLAGQVGADDRLIVTYAGHGSNEPEHWPGNEADGRDETLLLSGFAPEGAAAGERLRDDEIAELLALTPGDRTIFVADACHSGTLMRQIQPTLGFRYFRAGQPIDDPLPPPPPPSAATDEAGGALYLAAVDDASRVPEYLINGEARGALSYAFASGIRGAADLNGDGALTRRELEGHVRHTVRQVSSGLQQPRIAASTDLDAVVLGLTRGLAPAVPLEVDAPEPAPEPQTVFDRAFEDLPPVAFAVEGRAPVGLLSRLKGVAAVSPGSPATLTFDVEAGQLRSMVGDPIRRLVAADTATLAAEVQAVVDRIRVSEALAAEVGQTLSIRFGAGDRAYREGEEVGIRVAGRSAEHVTLFNLASDGTVHHLYPVESLGDPAALPAADPVAMGVRVTPPFGADHIVAFETDAPAPGLIAALEALSGSADPKLLWEELRFAMAGLETPPRIAIFPFHTLPDGS